MPFSYIKEICEPGKKLQHKKGLAGYCQDKIPNRSIESTQTTGFRKQAQEKKHISVARGIKSISIIHIWEKMDFRKTQKEIVAKYFTDFMKPVKA